jgi:hypothetical protein
MKSILPKWVGIKAESQFSQRQKWVDNRQLALEAALLPLLRGIKQISHQKINTSIYQ